MLNTFTMVLPTSGMMSIMAAYNSRSPKIRRLIIDLNNIYLNNI